MIDVNRSWFNGCFGTVVSTLNDMFEERHTRSVAAIGNSMGRFGALLFAKHLAGCYMAIAFAPTPLADHARR